MSKKKWIALGVGIVVIAVAVVLVLVLTKPSEEPVDAGVPIGLTPAYITGTWYLNAMDVMGMSMNPASMGMEMAMTLNEDNTAFAEMAGEEEGPTGSWAIVDDQVVVTMDGDDLALSLTDDGNLVAEQDEMKMTFGKEKAEVETIEASPARTDATLADFDGAWNAAFADMDGMKLPISALGLEFSATFDNGKATFTAFDSDAEMETAVSDGVLTATDVETGTVVVFTLHEDGAMSCSIAEEGMLLYFEKAE